MELVYSRITELATLSRTTKGATSCWLRENYDRAQFRVKGNRVVGVPPEIAEPFLSKRGYQSVYKKGFVAIFATQVGGAGKTVGASHTGMALRRITDRKTAVVWVDCDSQASLTSHLTGGIPEDDPPVLYDYFEKNCSVDDLLFDLGDNMWAVRSHLRNLYLDRAFKTPAATKGNATRLVGDIFTRFGEDTKIIFDTPPQLSNTAQSLYAAAAQGKHQTFLFIPVRSDSFSLRGAKIALREVYETFDTFNFNAQDRLTILCYLSNYDQRTRAAIRSLTTMSQDALLAEHLSPVTIRHSSEVSHAIDGLTSVFSDSKASLTIGMDFLDLVLAAMGVDYSKGD